MVLRKILVASSALALVVALTTPAQAGRRGGAPVIVVPGPKPVITDY